MSNIAYTPEQLEAAKKAKSQEELIAMAQEQGIEITPEQAAYFLKTQDTSPLPDEELDNVAGGHGGMCHKGTREVVSLVQWCVHGHKRYCDGCEHLSYESALWLCNLPDDMKAY